MLYRMAELVITGLCFRGSGWNTPRYADAKRAIRDMARFTNHAAGPFLAQTKANQRKYGIRLCTQEGMGRGLQCDRDMPLQKRASGEEIRSLAIYRNAVMHCFASRRAYDSYFHSYAADLGAVEANGVTVYLHVAAAVDTVTREPIHHSETCAEPDAQYANHNCGPPSAKLVMYCPYPDMLPILFLMQTADIPAGPIDVHYGSDFVMPYNRVARLPSDQTTVPCQCSPCQPIPVDIRNRMRQSLTSDGPSACQPEEYEWMDGPTLPPLSIDALKIMESGGMAPQTIDAQDHRERSKKRPKAAEALPASGDNSSSDDSWDETEASTGEKKTAASQRRRRRIRRITGIICQHASIKARCPACNGPPACPHLWPIEDWCYLCARKQALAIHGVVEPPPAQRVIRRIKRNKSIESDPDGPRDSSASAKPDLHAHPYGGSCYLCTQQEALALQHAQLTAPPEACRHPRMSDGDCMLCLIRRAQDDIPLRMFTRRPRQPPRPAPEN